MASTTEMIKAVVDNLQEQVPALKKLKLIFGVDIRAKRDIQTYRVEVPGAIAKKGRGEDERCRVEIDRAQFNQLADPRATLGTFRKVVENGHVRFQGDSNIAKLIVQVFEAREQRERLKKI